jgi:hypothetical protein
MMKLKNITYLIGLTIVAIIVIFASKFIKLHRK